MSVLWRNRSMLVGLGNYKCARGWPARPPVSPLGIAARIRAMTTLTFTLNDGNKIPWIAFGTGTALYSKDATKSVLTAIKSGFTHLDGAQMYANEDSLGDAIVQSGAPRSSLWVTTKLAAVPPGKDVRFTLEESLKKLKIDYVDLFLIHNPQQHPDLEGTWKQLEEIQKAGLTKSIGISNFTKKHLEKVLAVATVKPAVIQVRLVYRCYLSNLD